MNKEEFLNKIAPIVILENEKRGNPLFSSVVIAQAILETGFGTSSLMMKANAVFGIKAFSSWKGKVYSAKTKEVYDGNITTITDTFRAYNSLVESVSDYFDLICKSERYRKALTTETPEQCITAIKNGGYATDPNYVDKIMIIINQNNLTKYDVARETFVVNQNYLTRVDLNVRVGPGIEYRKKDFRELSEDGKKHAYNVFGRGILKKSTTVTVKHIVIDKDGNTWLEIPSGYIAGIYEGNVYVS